MDSKRISIKDVANMAGVSVSAVSRYLNNGYISTEKREAIANAITQTGYVPSRHAQMLRTRKTNIIGVVVPRINSEAIAKIVDGISSELSETRYRMILAITNNDSEKEIEYVKLFENNPVDGIILCGTIYTKMHKNLMKKVSVPVVIVGQQFDDYPCVYYNDYGAAKAITNTLIKSGCKKIICISITDKNIALGKNRINGYKDALKENGIIPEEELMKEAEFSTESGYHIVKAMLSKYDGIDGIVCTTDYIAAGAIKAIKEKGLDIPGDIQVTGIGHDRISSIVSPNLTTAHLFYRESGIEAVRMLRGLINGQRDGIRQFGLGFEIVKGRSTII